MRGTIVFDVNETLLDLAALDPRFEEGFGEAHVRKEWFRELLQQAFVITITGEYRDFGKIGRSALRVMEQRHRVELSEEQRSSIFEGMQELPPHADVQPGLERLRAAGWRLVTLGNSAAQVLEAQMKHAGLASHFYRLFSADTVQRLKPAPEPYRMVAAELGVATSSLMLVAAHSWDIAGAAKAGLQTAFLARPGQVLDGLTPKPSVVAADLNQLAELLG